MEICYGLGVGYPQEGRPRWESDEEYLLKYDHPLWQKFEEQAAGSGHGGMDFFILNEKKCYFLMKMFKI